MSVTCGCIQEGAQAVAGRQSLAFVWVASQRLPAAACHVRGFISAAIRTTRVSDTRNSTFSPFFSIARELNGLVKAFRAFFTSPRRLPCCSQEARAGGDNAQAAVRESDRGGQAGWERVKVRKTAADPGAKREQQGRKAHTARATSTWWMI